MTAPHGLGGVLKCFPPALGEEKSFPSAKVATVPAESQESEQEE